MAPVQLSIEGLNAIKVRGTPFFTPRVYLISKNKEQINL
jgi:hypothetical protein